VKPTVSKTFSVSSQYEATLWDQVYRFLVKYSFVKDIRQHVKGCISADLEADIETLVNKYQEQISNATFFEEQNADIKERLVYLFSVQDDLDRQKREAYTAIEEQTSKKTSSLLARKEPLNAECELQRRNIVAKCHEVQNLLSMVESRLSLNKEIFSCAADSHGDTLRPSYYFDQWSSSKPVGRTQTSKTATNAMFKSLTGGYDRVRELQSVVDSLSQKSISMSEANASNKSCGSTSAAKRKSRLVSSHKNMSPLPRKILTSPLAAKRLTQKDNKSFMKRQSLLRSIASDLFNKVHASKDFSLANRGSSAKGVPIPDWKSKGQNQLLPISRPQESRIVSKSAASPVAKTLFSSPLAGAKARPEWSIASERDTALLKVNIPQKLNEIDASDAAKSALAKFGTTPEKLARGRGIISQDAVESANTVKPFSSSSNTVFASISSKPSSSSGLSMSSATAFPPMSSKSPKPLSQAFSLSAQPQPTHDASSSGTKSAPCDYEDVLTTFLQENAPSKVSEVANYLQKYKGKEPEMFVSISKKFNKTNPLSKVFESRVKKVDQNDYLALLSLYLEVFNPTRKDQAADYVTKYKGKEKEMFASLANKYNACNALESPKTSTSTASIPSTLPQPTPTQKIDGGFNFFAKKEETKGSSSASGYPPLSATAPKPLGTSTATKEKKETSAAAPSPFTSTSNTAGSTDTTTASQSKDYVKLLTDFYQAHNPAKVSEVSSTLEKYKGKEPTMFAKLAQKYKTKNPLEEASTQAAAPASTSLGGFGTFGSSLPTTSQSPFGSTTATAAPSSTVSQSCFGFTTAPPSTQSPFGSTAAAPSSSTPFGSTPAAPTSSTPFGSTSPFGSTPAPSTHPSPFSSNAATPAPTPFGGTPGALGATGFGGTSTSTTGTSVFGQSAPATLFSSTPFVSTSAQTSTKFGGRSPRDMLVAFYQNHNPSKVGEVDKALAKYQGREELMFLNLAKKYNVDPAQFGIQQQQATGMPSHAPGFGSSFGSPGVLGGGTISGFGSTTPASSGFSSTPSSGGFGGFASTQTRGGFGALAGPSPSAYGGAAPASTPFGGGASPFGAARR